MKPVLSPSTALLAGAAMAAIFAGSASARSFAGTWSVSATFISGGRVVGTATPVCTFQQAGARISGTCKGPNGLGPAAGTVSGGTVNWQWNHAATTAYGVSGSTRFHGTVGPDGVIRGTAVSTVRPGLIGTFTEQRR